MTPHVAPEKLRDPDALSAEERATILDHVRTCRACRAALVAERPEALFGLLAQRPLPQEALERLSRNVVTALDRLDDRAEFVPARAGGSFPRRWLVAGALAASLLLAFLVGLPLLREDAGTRVAETTPAPRVVASEEPTPGPVRGIELLSSPGDAEVVDFAIGDAQVVMIFDKELDI